MMSKKASIKAKVFKNNKSKCKATCKKRNQYYIHDKHKLVTNM